MDEQVRKISEELVIACKRAYTRGIQTGSGGNVSARVPEKQVEALLLTAHRKGLLSQILMEI